MVRAIDKQSPSRIEARVRQKKSEAANAKGCAVVEALHIPFILTHTDYKQRLQISCAIFDTDRKGGMNKATVVTILRT